MTNEIMVCTLIEYCNSCGRCDNCELKKLYDSKVDKYTDDYGCEFEEMDEQMIKKIYGWYKELDLANCENAEVKEPNVDIVNHHKNIIEEIRRLFDLFDGNAEIFINKFNKTVDIHIKM